VRFSQFLIGFYLWQLFLDRGMDQKESPKALERQDFRAYRGKRKSKSQTTYIAQKISLQLAENTLQKGFGKCISTSAKKNKSQKRLSSATFYARLSCLSVIGAVFLPST